MYYSRPIITRFLVEHKAFIAIVLKNGDIVWLTSDYMQSFQFVKEKHSKQIDGVRRNVNMMLAPANERRAA